VSSATLAVSCRRIGPPSAFFYEMHTAALAVFFGLSSRRKRRKRVGNDSGEQRLHDDCQKTDAADAASAQIAAQNCLPTIEARVLEWASARKI